MSTSSMNIRMDSDVKNQAQKLFKEFGMDMTTAINVFLRQAIRERSIPFKIQLDIPNAETVAAIQEVQKMKKNAAMNKTYDNVEDMMKDILK